MELHITTVVKIKRINTEKLSVFNKTSEVLKYLPDGRKPSSLLVFLPHHKNPATQTDTSKDVLFLRLYRFLKHKLSSCVNILDVIMLNSSKVHKEVNTNKYFYWFKFSEQRREQRKYGH